jgi:hypothetical protein
MFLCEHKFSFLWDKCPAVQLLCGMVVRGLGFEVPSRLFCTILRSHQQYIRDPASFHSICWWHYILYLNSAIQINVQCSLIVVWICVRPLWLIILDTFRILICHLYSLFSAKSAQAFAHLLIRLFLIGYLVFNSIFFFQCTY